MNECLLLEDLVESCVRGERGPTVTGCGRGQCSRRRPGRACVRLGWRPRPPGRPGPGVWPAASFRRAFRATNLMPDETVYLGQELT